MMAARESVTMGGGEGEGGIGVANGRTYSFVRWLNSLVINRSCTRACTVAQGKTTGGANTREATVDCTKAVIGPIIRDIRELCSANSCQFRRCFA